MYDPRELGLEVRGGNNNEVYCLCPFHDDRSPSACFNVKKGVLFCFVCGRAAGVKRIAKQLNGRVVRTKSLPQFKKKNPIEWRQLLNSKIAIDNAYLKGRRVSNELVEKYKIKELPYGIVFPVQKINRKTTTGIVIRRYTGDIRYLSLGEVKFWPSNLEEMGDVVLLTEGPFGALRAMSAGVDATCCFGIAKAPDAIKHLKSKTVVPTFDDDYAGILAAAKMIRMGYFVGLPLEVDEAEPKEIRDNPVTTSITRLANLADKPMKLFNEVSRWKPRRV